jgi:TRAP-type C4-dicarboxylate transport system permease small subunit
VGRLHFLSRFASLAVRTILKLSRVVNYVGASVLGLLILFVAGDVIGRYIFNAPIKGDFELVVLATGIIACLGLADALANDGHIRIDILTSRFPRSVRLVLDVFAHFLGCILWAFVAWRVFLYGITLKKSHSISGMLPIPVFPFVFIVAFGCVVLCLVFVTKLAYCLAEVTKR